jgi:hypothetical protein
MTSYVMFRNGPTIRGELAHVQFATVAVIQAMVWAGGGAIVLGCSEDLQEWLIQEQQRWPARFILDDHTIAEAIAWLTEADQPLELPAAIQH